MPDGNVLFINGVKTGVSRLLDVTGDHKLINFAVTLRSWLVMAMLRIKSVSRTLTILVTSIFSTHF